MGRSKGNTLTLKFLTEYSAAVYMDLHYSLFLGKSVAHKSTITGKISGCEMMRPPRTATQIQSDSMGPKNDPLCKNVN